MKRRSIAIALVIAVAFIAVRAQAFDEYTREEHITYYDDAGQIVGEWHKDCYNNYITWGEWTPNSVLEQWDHCQPISDPGWCTLQWDLILACSGTGWGMSFTGCKIILIGSPHCTQP